MIRIDVVVGGFAVAVAVDVVQVRVRVGVPVVGVPVVGVPVVGVPVVGSSVSCQVPWPVLLEHEVERQQQWAKQQAEADEHCQGALHPRVLSQVLHRVASVLRERIGLGA